MCHHYLAPFKINWSQMNIKQLKWAGFTFSCLEMVTKGTCSCSEVWFLLVISSMGPLISTQKPESLHCCSESSLIHTVCIARVNSSPIQCLWRCLSVCFLPLGTDTWCVLPTACQCAYIRFCSSSSIGWELSVMTCSSSSPSRSSMEIRAILTDVTVRDKSITKLWKHERGFSSSISERWFYCLC